MAVIKGLYPVFLAKKGTKFPAKGTFFVVASNGAFVHKDYVHWEGLVPMPLKDVPGVAKVGYFVTASNGDACVNVEAPPPKWQTWKKDEDEEDDVTLTMVDRSGKESAGDDKLLAVDPYINMNLPKLDPRIIYKALLFFRRVYNQHKAEAIVVIAYNLKTKEYGLFCPVQKVSGGHIDYDRQLAQRENSIRDNEDPEWAKMLQDGFIPVGTIHSHCNFQAFHSGTDTGDEASFDGVHVTLGHVVDQEFSVACSLALNNYREPVDLENVALGVKRVGNQKATQSNYISTGYQNYYGIDLPAPQKQQLRDQFEADIDKNWMGKVTHETFFVGGYGGYSGGWQGGGHSNPYGRNSWEDEEDDMSQGTSYVLVNNVWVKESDIKAGGNGNGNPTAKEEDEFNEAWSDYAKQHGGEEDTKDLELPDERNPNEGETN